MDFILNSYWSVGVWGYSSTPGLRSSRDLGNPGIAFDNKWLQRLSFLIDQILDTFLDLMVAEISAHAGTGSRHGLPVGAIHQDAFDKGPFSAHMRFNLMNRAQLIPEYTIPVFSLSNQRFAAGHLAVTAHKSFAIQPQIPADPVNLSFGDIGAAIPPAALPAILAGKQIFRPNRIRGHDGSPWLFSE